MAEDEKVKAEFLQKTKEIERLLLRSMKIEERIAKLNTKIKEAEEAAKEPGPKGDSQGSVGSPQPHNNQAEVIADLKEQVAKELVKLANVNKKLNKGGRRRTRRGGRPPDPPEPTREKLEELERNLMANPGEAGNVLDYLIAAKSYFPRNFVGSNAELSEAVRQRNNPVMFVRRVTELVISLKAALPPRPVQLPVLARLRPPRGGRHRTSRRTRKSRKTRRS